MSNASLVNFAAGEISPKTRGRFDINSYNSSCQKLENYIPDVQGPARYRPGFKRLIETYNGVPTRKIPFCVSSTLSYMLEFTPGYLRVFLNGVVVQTGIATPYVTAADLDNLCATYNSTIMKLVCAKYAPRTLVRSAAGVFSLVVLPRVHDPFGTSTTTEEVTTVSSVSRTDKCVVAVASATGLDGAYGYITDLTGVDELEERLVKFKLITGTSFYILDPATEEYINTSGAAAKYSSGGKVNTVALTSFNDACNIIGISTGSVTVITWRTGDNPSSGDLANLYYFEGIEGTTELNGRMYSLTDTTDDAEGHPRSILRTAGNNDVDSSTWGAYESGGYAMRNRDLPRTAAFYETRFVVGGTMLRPGTIFGSRATGNLGDSRYEDFTGGTNDDDAYFFTLSPVNGSADEICWVVGVSRYLVIGAVGGIFRASGGGVDTAITPTSISVRQIDARGGIFNDTPVSDGNLLYFVQSGGVALRGLKYSSDVDDLVGYNVSLGAEHIAAAGIKKSVLQTGFNDILWLLRDDGQLAGITVNADENVTGWHRHRVGGTDAKVIDIAVLPLGNENDELWVTVQRTVNGSTAYSVEILTEEVSFPDPEDFFTGEENSTADRTAYLNAIYRLQERYIHLDGASTYNGSARGVTAGATLTPGATTGESITFTASEDVFTAGDVGSEIWKKADVSTGIGEGRAVITAFTDAKNVVCEITADFDSTSAIAAGDWYIAVDEVSGLSYLEAERVAVVTDGAVYSDGISGSDYPEVIVASGAITLTAPAAVVHVGLPYRGVLITQNLEMGGQTGPAQAKPRNISSLAIRFLASLGGEYGTDVYHMTPVVDLMDGQIAGRPAPVFSGIKELSYSDDWSGDNSEEKRVVIMQNLPLPCVVQFIDVEYSTADGE